MWTNDILGFIFAIGSFLSAVILLRDAQINAISFHGVPTPVLFVYTVVLHASIHK